MPAVDLQSTIVRFGFDVELLREMATMYCEDAPQRLSQLTTAFADGDRRGVQFAAHALKGMAGTFGAARVVEAADKLESLAIQEHFAAMPPWIDELREAIEEVLTILSRYEMVR